MMYMGEAAADIEMAAELTGKKTRMKNFELTTWFLGLMGRTYSAGDFVREMRKWNDVGRSFASFFKKYDVYLTPVTATPPLRIGKLQRNAAENFILGIINRLGLGGIMKASGMISKLVEADFARFPFTQIVNLAGLPAMSVRCTGPMTGCLAGFSSLAGSVTRRPCSGLHHSSRKKSHGLIKDPGIECGEQYSLFPLFRFVIEILRNDSVIAE
jgi:amidase